MAAVAHNIDDVATLTMDCTWDQAAVAAALEPLCLGADLILTGREFGDLDDGMVPTLLASRLGAPFFGRAQIVAQGDQISFHRELGKESQAFRLESRALVSATNDRRTRLRKPLM